MSRIVLVGELNPYGEDPSFALYCSPPNSAGGRCRAWNVPGAYECSREVLRRADPELELGTL